MDIHEVTLRGKHVALEPLRTEHARELAGPGAESDIWTYLGYVVRGRDDVERWVRDRVAMPNALPFLQRDASTGAAFGSTSLFDIDAKNKRMEIGHTWLGKTHRRTAANTEAKLLLLTHAFETLGANRVQLKTDGENLRSQAAIARIGATREGTLRSWIVDERGEARDRVFFSIIKPEWPAKKKRLEEMLRRDG